MTLFLWYFYSNFYLLVHSENPLLEAVALKAGELQYKIMDYLW